MSHDRARMLSIGEITHGRVAACLCRRFRLRVGSLALIHIRIHIHRPIIVRNGVRDGRE